jgi:hypothetical protein
MSELKGTPYTIKEARLLAVDERTDLHIAGIINWLCDELECRYKNEYEVTEIKQGEMK